MPAQYSFCLTRRLGLPYALAGLILMIAAPAAAQFRIGPGGFGMGIELMSPPVQQAPPVQQYNPPPSSRKARNARRVSAANERHAKVARAKAPAKSDSNSSGAF
jgi:hypothetical protein